MGGGVLSVPPQGGLKGRRRTHGVQQHYWIWGQRGGADDVGVEPKEPKGGIKLGSITFSSGGGGL